MILLFGAALLLFQAEANFINSLRSHLIENLKFKCEALPFRAIYDGSRCYFAVFQKVVYSDAPSQCSNALKGAKVALDTPSATLEKMFVDKSKFHTGDSSEAKHTLCVYESGYKCEKGQTMLNGMCVSRAEKKMTFADARKSCKNLAMELFSPDNDLDNQIITRELVKTSAWIQKGLESRRSKMMWTIGKSYSRFTTCDGKSKKPPFYAGFLTSCNNPLSTAIDKTGYWSNADPKTEMEVICSKIAPNELTPVNVLKKPSFDQEGPCVEQHVLDETTGKCEWTGHPDACCQLLNYWNNSHFINMVRFPNQLQTEECLRTTRNEMDDYAVKVVVRRGCMFTGYAYPHSEDIWNEVKIGENLIYGAHKLPSYMSGHMTAEFANYYQGLSRVNCFCDPTEATVSGHEPAPPPNRKCVEYHEFNETTQQCEWKLDPKYCGEIWTSDNRKMMLEIPNWPATRKYDVNHYYTNANANFHITVTSIIVRQHCFATAYWGRQAHHPWKTMPTMGYGHHIVASKDNQLASAGFGGSARFVCECIR